MDDRTDPAERCKSDVFVSYPYLLHRKWCVMVSLFHDSSPPSLRCDRTRSRYLERSCCRCPYCIPTVSWFQALGYAYDVVWTIIHLRTGFFNVFYITVYSFFLWKIFVYYIIYIIYYCVQFFFFVFFHSNFILVCTVFFSEKFLQKYKCLTSLQAIIGGGSERD